MKSPISCFHRCLNKGFILILIIAFILSSLPVVFVEAQELPLPSPGVMVSLSPEYNPPLLKGVKVYPNEPFRFEFILDKGDYQSKGQGIDLKAESTKLIKYFLASMTTPEEDLWVNLSPYEKDRVIPEAFGKTEMGRDLLAQDYMLKQITASLIYPEGEIGGKFWKKVYEEAAKKYKTTNIPVNTFNKVWIVPEKAVVYENLSQAGEMALAVSPAGGPASEGLNRQATQGTNHKPTEAVAYVVESKLKVMLEEDYVAVKKRGDSPSKGTDPMNVSSQIVREIVLPALEKEINQGKNFAQLRQVYNSLILAQWYKKKIKDSILAKVYADQNKIAGLSGDSPSKGTVPLDVEGIYQQYLQAFKKGVYNYIKEEQDPISQQMMPRKYFSGGFTALGVSDMMQQATLNQTVQVLKVMGSDQAMKIMVDAKIVGGNEINSKDASQLTQLSLDKPFMFKGQQYALTSIRKRDEIKEIIEQWMSGSQRYWKQRNWDSVTMKNPNGMLVALSKQSNDGSKVVVGLAYCHKGIFAHSSETAMYSAYTIDLMEVGQDDRNNGLGKILVASVINQSFEDQTIDSFPGTVFIHPAETDEVMGSRVREDLMSFYQRIGFQQVPGSVTAGDLDDQTQFFYLYISSDNAKDFLDLTLNQLQELSSEDLSMLAFKTPMWIDEMVDDFPNAQRSYLDRHHPQWDYLKRNVMPQLIKQALTERRGTGKPQLKILDLGASTGEEMGRIFYETIQSLLEQGQEPGEWDIKIIGLENDARVVAEGNRRLRGQKAFARGRKRQEQVFIGDVAYSDAVIKVLNQHRQKFQDSVVLMAQDIFNAQQMKMYLNGSNLIIINHVLRIFPVNEQNKLISQISEDATNAVVTVGDEKLNISQLDTVATHHIFEASDLLENQTAYFFGLPLDFLTDSGNSQLRVDGAMESKKGVIEQLTDALTRWDYVPHGSDDHYKWIKIGYHWELERNGQLQINHNLYLDENKRSRILEFRAINIPNKDNQGKGIVLATLKMIKRYLPVRWQLHIKRVEHNETLYVLLKNVMEEGKFGAVSSKAREIWQKVQDDFSVMDTVEVNSATRQILFNYDKYQQIHSAEGFKALRDMADQTRFVKDLTEAGFIDIQITFSDPWKMDITARQPDQQMQANPFQDPIFIDAQVYGNDKRSYLDRHHSQWEFLKDKVLPYLIERALNRKGAQERPRLVIADLGASTGEEMARIFYEIMSALKASEQNPDDWDIQIDGFDLDAEMVEEAQRRLANENPFSRAPNRKKETIIDGVSYVDRIMEELNFNSEKFNRSWNLYEQDVSKLSGEYLKDIDLVVINHVIRDFDEEERDSLFKNLGGKAFNAVLAVGDLSTMSGGWYSQSRQHVFVDPQLSSDKTHYYFGLPLELIKQIGFQDMVRMEEDQEMQTQSSKTGGIDLSSGEALLIQNEGQEIKFNFDSAMFSQLQNAAGFYPVIVHMESFSAGEVGMVQLKGFLGVDDTSIFKVDTPNKSDNIATVI